MIGTKKCANFGGKWVSPPLKQDSLIPLAHFRFRILLTDYLLGIRLFNLTLTCNEFIKTILG